MTSVRPPNDKLVKGLEEHGDYNIMLAKTMTNIMFGMEYLFSIIIVCLLVKVMEYI